VLSVLYSKTIGLGFNNGLNLKLQLDLIPPFWMLMKLTLIQCHLIP